MLSNLLKISVQVWPPYGGFRLKVWLHYGLSAILRFEVIIILLTILIIGSSS